MKYRKLRIAWSVAWGVACLLMIALWVRSYQWVDLVYVGDSHTTISWRGNFYFHNVRLMYPAGRQEFSHEYGAIVLASIWNGDQAVFIWRDPRAIEELNPHVAFWSLILLCVILGVACWMPWRFSLRTLLIVMTLVAVGLGVIVYAVR
jgi:hypothetical protein